MSIHGFRAEPLDMYVLLVVSSVSPLELCSMSEDLVTALFAESIFSTISLK